MPPAPLPSAARPSRIRSSLLRAAASAWLGPLVLALAGACGGDDPEAPRTDPAPPPRAEADGPGEVRLQVERPLGALLEEMLPAFRERHPEDEVHLLVRTFQDAGSSELPFDVFVSADDTLLGRVGELAGEPRRILRVDVALLGQSTAAGAVKGPLDLLDIAGRVALDEPLEPLGRAVRAFYAGHRKLREMQGRFAPTHVQSAIELVEASAVPFGFCFAADLDDAVSSQILWISDPSEGLEIAYLAGVTAAGDSPLARELFEWLAGEELREAAVARGFSPPR